MASVDDRRDLGCIESAPLEGTLGNWATAKRIVMEVVSRPKEGIKEVLEQRDAIQDVIYDGDAEASCKLGHFSLRLAFFLLVSPLDRAMHLCHEPSPTDLGASFVEILASGWPVFGLLSLLSYRQVKDGFVREVGHMAREDALWECSKELESFRVRYWPATFENSDVSFSRDVEAHVLSTIVDPREIPFTANLTQHCRCLFGGALPFLGHAASLQCHARRDTSLHQQVTDILDAAERKFLRPALALVHRSADGLSARFCSVNAREPSRVSLFSALTLGFWAAEAFSLLQWTAPAFASHGPCPPLGGPVAPAGNKVVVSLDPHEGEFYGRGLAEFVSHIWSDGRVPGFIFQPALPCADVLIVRDSLPSPPFPGALIYVDHEAGLGPGRDAGRMDGILRRHNVVYLGVLEPLAETRCMSRVGSASARARRVCAKVFSGRAQPPSHNQHGRANADAPGHVSPGAQGSQKNMEVVHVPFASTSFSNRWLHQPSDLALASRPYADKPYFLGYLAYTCVDHREQLFDLLVYKAAEHDLGAAEALSKCSGYRSGHRRVRRNLTRGDEASFLDDAVELLKPYRFALVFENKLVPGYVTEKIVNAFLAGSIPIYWGTRAVLEIFNRDAFIYANELQGSWDDANLADPLVGLEHVVDEVVKIAQDPIALRKMATAPVLSRSQLHKYFSWHRDLAGSASSSAGDDLAQRLSKAVSSVSEPRMRMALCSDDGQRIGRLCFASY